jgi:hypothetical protein
MSGSAKYVQRLVVHEEPRIIEQLQARADDSGSSVAAVVRRLIRHQLQQEETSGTSN